MAKKPRDEVPNPNSVSNRDIIQRLNFLYQASVYLNSIDGGKIKANDGDADAATARKNTNKRKRVVSTSDLSRSYIKSMKIVGQKTTVKMDPSVKRTLCRGCNIVLIPGSTATVRVKSARTHGHTVTYTCTSCNASKRIPAPPTLVPDAEPPPVPGSMAPISLPSAPVAADPQMDTDAPQPETLDSRQRNQKKKKKPPTPRLPPLFARDGHVVFVGNERLEPEA